MNEITTAFARLPQPLPAEISNRLGYYHGQIVQDHPLHEPVTRDLPTPADCKDFETRLRELKSALAPASESKQAMERVRDAIHRMLGGYLNIFGNPDEIGAGWTAELQRYPAWAVVSVCSAITENVGGLGLDPKKPPTVPQLHAFVRRRMEIYTNEQDRIERVLKVKKVLPTPPERKPDAAELRRMREPLPADPAEREAAIARLKKRDEDRIRRDAEQRDRMILAEYARHGETPVYSKGGALVCRTIAKQIETWSK